MNVLSKRRVWGWCLGTALVCSLFSSAVPAMSPISLKPPGGPATMPRSYFGLHIHRPTVAGKWPTVLFGAWRLWDANVNWMDLEPQRGRWDFARLDADIARAQAAGIEIVVPFALSPVWASARPGEPSAYGQGHAAEPADMADWRNYVRTVATRYRGRVLAYELWNEAADKPFYSGSQKALLDMTRIAHDEVKAIDPAALIVAPSVWGMDARVGLVRKFLDAGGAQWVDVASYHMYHQPSPPESMIDSIRKLRADLDAGGYSKLPLWNTESGYFMSNSPTVPNENWSDYELARRISPAQAAPYVVRDLLLARAMGVERFFWYAWDNFHLGMIEPADNRLRGVGVAFGNAVSYLMRSTLEGCDRDKLGAWICRLTLANGKTARVLWQDPEAGEEPLRLPAPFTGNLKSFENEGDQSIKVGESIILSAHPVLLVQQGP